jgi:hypothetical protein
MTDTEMSHQHLSLNIIKGTLLKANTSVFFSYRECVLSQKEIIKKRRNNKREREREKVCVCFCVLLLLAINIVIVTVGSSREIKGVYKRSPSRLMPVTFCCSQSLLDKHNSISLSLILL